MFFSRAWKAYEALLLSHPVKTKALTSATLFAGGDVLSQSIEYKLSDEDNNEDNRTTFSSKYDVKRTLRMGTVGLLVGPWLHHWYNFLGKKVVPPNTEVLTKIPVVCGWSASNRVVVKQVLFDQGLFAPVTISGVFVTLGLLEGKTFSEIAAPLPSQMLQALATNYLIWPMAMFVNFRFIPLEKRVLVSNGVGLVYNTCLSFIAHAK